MYGKGDGPPHLRRVVTRLSLVGGVVMFGSIGRGRGDWGIRLVGMGERVLGYGDVEDLEDVHGMNEFVKNVELDEVMAAFR